MTDHAPDIKARAQAAIDAAEKMTPTPWRIDGAGNIVQTRHITRDVWVIPHSDDDMPGIVTLRNDAPAVIADLLAALGQAEQSRDLAIAQRLMVGAELCADPQLDPGDTGDPRWTPTIVEARRLRERAEQAEREVASEPTRQRDEAWAALNAIADGLGVVHENPKIVAAVRALSADAARWREATKGLGEVVEVVARMTPGDLRVERDRLDTQSPHWIVAGDAAYPHNIVARVGDPTERGALHARGIVACVALARRLAGIAGRG